LGEHAQAAPFCKSGLMSDIPRGKFIGERIDGKPSNEAEHFMRCPTCGGWLDMRDLGQVFDHEGPLPHPAGDKPQ
jgi:hypothetical protein